MYILKLRETVRVIIKNLRFIFKLLLFPLIAVLVLWGGYLLSERNFATVEEGVLYRSAQVDEDEIEEYIHKYGVKSILNLRGVSTADWYSDEVQLSKQLGITHYDLNLSAFDQPNINQMLEMVHILKTAPKPLLVHCWGGADRTGLASALYEYAIQGKTADEAKKNLSILHGHFPYLGSKTDAMDKAFDQFVSIYNPKQLQSNGTLR